jgi:hypothetical protein
MTFFRSLFTNRVMASIIRWFDSEAGLDEVSDLPTKQVDWIRILPLMVLHVGCLGGFVVGWSGVAVGTAIVPSDPHSPLQHGFWWSHIGWLTSRSNFATRYRYVRDWAAMI